MDATKAKARMREWRACQSELMEAIERARGIKRWPATDARDQHERDCKRTDCYYRTTDQ